MDDKKWKEKLTPEQYQVCRLKQTEPAFTGLYWNKKDSGIYCCICCEFPLFHSQDKFDSGTGWPSYLRPCNDEAVKEIIDESHGMRRVEVLCAHCDAHLGHVFPDGPYPTGLRYCINSAALSFKEKDKKKIK